MRQGWKWIPANVVKLRTTTVQNRIESGSLWLRIKKLWYVSKLRNHFRFKELYYAFFSRKRVKKPIHYFASRL